MKTRSSQGRATPFADPYARQVALLLRVMPHVMAQEAFALKGGTAINLFIRDLPRLSVDIDLTYLPVQSREASLAAIDAAMMEMGAAIRAGVPGAQVAPSRLHRDNIVSKLVVRLDGVQIKIEVTPVTCGCVYEPEIRSLSPAVEDRFGSGRMRLVSFADLYAGKIVAALDRQHPRDLFDVRDLLAAEGVSDDLRRAFLVYMMSHDRPFHEVLAPPRKPLEDEYRRNFVGMTEKPVALEALTEAREALIAEVVGAMPDDHRRLLLGFKRGEPDWDLLGLPHVADLPAVRWKQQNLDRLSPERRAALAGALEQVLSGGPGT